MDQHRRSDEQHQATGEAQQEGAPEHGLLLGLVSPPEGLGDETGRRRAKEVEGREDDVEDDRADGEPADQGGIAQLADHRHVDDAEQRGRQVSERHRHRDRKHHAVGDREGARRCAMERQIFQDGLRRGHGPRNMVSWGPLHAGIGLPIYDNSGHAR
jgi:hypothetical protein